MANKAELIGKVSEILGEALGEKISKSGQGLNGTVVVDSVVEALQELLLNTGEVKVTDFGTFKVKERAARKARNPQTGEEMDVPATKVATFKPAPKFKDAVKGS